MFPLAFGSYTFYSENSNSVKLFGDFQALGRIEIDPFCMQNIISLEQLRSALMRPTQTQLLSTNFAKYRRIHSRQTAN